MTLTLIEIARLVGGTLRGPEELVIAGAETLHQAAADEITFAEGDKGFKQIAATRAAAVIVGAGAPPVDLPSIEVSHVHAAFAQVVEHFRPRRARPDGVHPTARVSPQATIAPDVAIGPGATIGDDVEIAAGCHIGAGVVIEPGCRIGARTTIFPNAVLYEGTLVGEECLIHAGAVLGAYGFGYAVVEGRHQLSAQLGYVVLGPRVEVGAGTTIDRGTYGATSIGEGTKIDNQVQIAHNCRIGRHNLICSQVGIAGSSTTGDYVVMAGQVGIRDHVHIGDGVQLGAKAGVMHDLLQPGGYVGAPAGPEREYFQCLLGFQKLPEMRKQFKQLQRDIEQLKGSLAPGQARSEAA
jgi:UDP-3-O-[3-hydroxymyristoyl] glucosamine N-acyltransferase